MFGSGTAYPRLRGHPVAFFVLTHVIVFLCVFAPLSQLFYFSPGEFDLPPKNWSR